MASVWDILSWYSPVRKHYWGKRVPLLSLTPIKEANQLEEVWRRHSAMDFYEDTEPNNDPTIRRLNPEALLAKTRTVGFRHVVAVSCRPDVQGIVYRNSQRGAAANSIVLEIVELA